MILRVAYRAFTLVEILVVMGVIVILIAVLLPSLGVARSHARATACASNLRGIGSSCIAYGSEWNYIPNNSYTIGDDPATISPPPPAGTVGATTALNRGTFSTSNFEWFDAVAQNQGWTGKRTVAARFGIGEQFSFRQKMKYLWCPEIDVSLQDPGVWATDYGICRNVSTAYNVQKTLPTSGEGPYDFLAFSRAAGTTGCVLMTESCFYNFNSDAYDLTNASIGNVVLNQTTKIPGKINHAGINYLYFDGHVERLPKPPHSMGGELGTFATLDPNHYTITSAQDNQFRASFGLGN